MQVQYTTKTYINTAGEECIPLKRTWKHSDFLGESDLSRTDIFPGVLKRLVQCRCEKGVESFKLSKLPYYVKVEGEGLFRTVTINLNKYQPA